MSGLDPNDSDPITYWLNPGETPGEKDARAPGFGSLGDVPDFVPRRGQPATLFAPASPGTASRTQREQRTPRTDRSRSEAGRNRTSRSRNPPSARASSHSTTRPPSTHQRAVSSDKSGAPFDSVTDNFGFTHSHLEEPEDTRPRTPLDFFDFSTLPSQTSPSNPGRIHTPSPFPGSQHRRSRSSQYPASLRNAASDPFTPGPRNPFLPQYSPHYLLNSINPQQNPLAFDPFDSNSSRPQYPVPPPTAPPPAIVVQRATPRIPHASIPTARQGHRRSHSDSTEISQSPNLLVPHRPFIPRPRSTSAPRVRHHRHASAGSAATSSAMALQQPFPATENRSPAPGISFTPQQIDLSRREGEVDQGLEANRQALQEMEQAGRQREEERAMWRGKITTLLDEKSVLNEQKTDLQAWRLAVKRVDDRLGTARRSLKRFDERWSYANAQLLEYRGKYGEPSQY